MTVSQVAYSCLLRLIVSIVLISIFPIHAALAEEPSGSAPAPDSTKEPSTKRLTINGMTIVFTGENEAVVETGGQSVKINTATQSAVEMKNELVEGPTATAPAATTDKTAAKEQGASEKKTAEEAEPETYYGYELINVPTPRRYEKYAFSVHFTHRFTQPVFIKSAPSLFGLDSFSISSLGFSFGITDRIYAKIYRSPIDRTIEIGGGIHLLTQREKNPFSASVYSSVEGRDNFNEHFTTNIVGMLGHAFSRYGSAFFAPTISIHSNPFRDLNPIGPNNTGSFGFGGQFNFRPTASFLFEYTPRVGYKSGPNAEVAFGLQKRTYRHIFTLTLSNTVGTTTSQYNSGFGDFSLDGLGKGLVIGFNIWRRLF